MTTETDIKDALSPLVGGRVFPDVAPPKAARPCITYQQVGGRPVAFMERALPSKKNGRFQINTICSSRTEAAALALQIHEALILATSMQATPLDEPTALAPDTTTDIYGTRQDFSIWSDR
jgi:hypothetical protein